ncbi:MAG TPA: lipopolysaccharide biosynthesis protein [Candidatus Limnocylindria bacterium]
MGGGQAEVMFSGIGLIAGRVAAMGLGFVSWLLAARLFSPAEVGLASGLVSAMMLCVQLALLGIGSAAIAAFPRHRKAPDRLFNTGATSVVMTSGLVGVGFLALAAFALEELRVVATAGYAAAFLAMTVFGTLNTYYDYVSIAIHRGAQILLRNTAFGLVVIIAIALVWGTSGLPGSLAIIVGWAVAGLVACLLALMQLRRGAMALRPRAAFERPIVRDLVREGIPNWMLTLTERAPALILPILVTELLSPTTNAFWYAVWMMGWVVLIVPISIGQTLFAEASQHPDAIGPAVSRAVRSSLVIGLIAAVGLALVADVALGLLGPSYASAGAFPLRILVASVIPVSVIQMYYAVCRARGALREAVLTGAGSGAVALTITMLGGVGWGLIGMAVGWLAVQGVAAGWAALRIRALVSRPIPERIAPA